MNQKRLISDKYEAFQITTTLPYIKTAAKCTAFDPLQKYQNKKYILNRSLWFIVRISVFHRCTRHKEIITNSKQRRLATYSAWSVFWMLNTRRLFMAKAAAFIGELTTQVHWCLRVVSHPALRLQSSNEPPELATALIWWQHHKHHGVLLLVLKYY